jgi:chitosanase
MGITELQKKTAQAIVNIFETGRAEGDYAAVTFHPEDPGHLTYGRSQTTLASGNLYLLIKAYCDAQQAHFAGRLRAYLGPLAQRDTSLDHNKDFRDCLAIAGADPVMCDVQDQFFDRVYWAPSEAAATILGVSSPLGTSIVYDSYVHGAWKKIKELTNAQGSAGDGNEREWVERYVKNRRHWLAEHGNTLLRRTVYRMDAFQQLIDEQQWDLVLPLRVRAVEITEPLLNPAIRVSAHMDEEERILRLETPFMEGEDVRSVQAALRKSGFHVAVDGVFGKQTGSAVIEFQKRRGLVVDGVVGPATRTQLGV